MVKFILYYDSWLCVYNNLAVSIVRAHDNKDFFVKLKVDFFILYFQKRILIFPLEWMTEREGKDCVSCIFSILAESQPVQPFR